MLKSTEVPSELKHFNSLFFSFTYKYNLSNLFDDLLTICICLLARQTEEKLYLETIKKYNRKELDIFAKLFAELFIIYDQANNFGEWVDPLGDYYEALASNSKKSSFGQFFTPKGICDLMAGITIDKNKWNDTINDPCCGSGRLLLASNQIKKGAYYVAQDLDGICCKMTAINMAMQNIRGEVHHMDTLRMIKPFVSYSINYNFHKHKTPLILLQKKAS